MALTFQQFQGKGSLLSGQEHITLVNEAKACLSALGYEHEGNTYFLKLRITQK